MDNYNDYIAEVVDDVNKSRTNKWSVRNRWWGGWRNYWRTPGSKGELVKMGAKATGAGVAALTGAVVIGTVTLPITAAAVAAVSGIVWCVKKARDPGDKSYIERYYEPMGIGGGVARFSSHAVGEQVTIEVNNGQIRLPKDFGLPTLEVLNRDDSSRWLNYLLHEGVNKCFLAFGKLKPAQEAALISLQKMRTGWNEDKDDSEHNFELFEKAAQDLAYFHRRTLRFKLIRVTLLHCAISWFIRTEEESNKAERSMGKLFAQVGRYCIFDPGYSKERRRSGRI